MVDLQIVLQGSSCARSSSGESTFQLTIGLGKMTFCTILNSVSPR